MSNSYCSRSRSSLCSTFLIFFIELPVDGDVFATFIDMTVFVKRCSANAESGWLPLSAEDSSSFATTIASVLLNLPTTVGLPTLGLLIQPDTCSRLLAAKTSYDTAQALLQSLVTTHRPPRGSIAQGTRIAVCWNMKSSLGISYASSHMEYYSLSDERWRARQPAIQLL